MDVPKSQSDEDNFSVDVFSSWLSLVCVDNSRHAEWCIPVTPAFRWPLQEHRRFEISGKVERCLKENIVYEILK